jgi:retron-type reverse transcriptase
MAVQAINGLCPRVETLKAAWQKVEANAGAAGVDGQSVERFAARAEMYLEELSTALKRGTYRPQPSAANMRSLMWLSACVDIGSRKNVG